MPIQYLPPKSMPPGHRSYQDVVAEIEAAEGLRSTGWHYAYEPSAVEIESKRTGFHRASGELVPRHIVTGSKDCWTLFERVKG